MDAIFNDRKEVWPVNVPNHGAIADFPDDLVVEVPGYVDRTASRHSCRASCPARCAGWSRCWANTRRWPPRRPGAGTRRDAIRALASNPLCFSLAKAETIYDEMAAAHSAYLPERLLH